MYTHALAQVASLACDDPAVFSMNWPCDLEIRAFVEQLQFGDFARTAIENILAAILCVILRTLHSYRNPTRRFRRRVDQACNGATRSLERRRAATC